MGHYFVEVPQGIKCKLGTLCWVTYLVEAPEGIKGKSSTLCWAIYLVEAPQGIKGKSSTLRPSILQRVIYFVDGFSAHGENYLELYLNQG